jgi:hypothetical protein
MHPKYNNFFKKYLQYNNLKKPRLKGQGFGFHVDPAGADLFPAHSGFPSTQGHGALCWNL